uniref:Fibronectin type-III domain-containing protein n=1 Tax=Meloidogyne javanica TaxID=6303 RepID=A0A915N733_MELJA
MKLFLTKFTILFLLFINESSSSAIRNLRSHYDAGTDTILVDWEWDELSGGLGRQQLEDYEIFVRYKVSRQGQNEDEWRRVEAEEDGLGARIPLGRLSLSDGDEVMTQIRVDKTNFLLGHLVPGERYEITLRSATSSDRISSAAAIVEIALPKEDEGALMDVGNLLVTSRFMHDGRGVVNLTWEVPPQLIGKIKSYEMRYIEASNAQSGIERWEHLHFPGEAPHAQLYSMKPYTEYLIRIRTLLISGLQVESGEFRIHTPRIKEPNPLARLDVLYSSEQPTVRLQWTHIHSSEINGYDLSITDRYDLPESEWRHHRVSGYSPQLALDNLRPYTTYFVRVDIRKNSGDVLKGNTIYRFTTLANLPVIPTESFVDKGNEVQPLAFEQIDRGRVTIYFSNNPNEPMERWQRVLVENIESRSTILAGLQENILYNIQIVPNSRDDGRPMWEHSKRMQIRSTSTLKNKLEGERNENSVEKEEEDDI